MVALTPRSSPNADVFHNERLELLGDAVLNMVVSTSYFKEDLSETDIDKLTEVKTCNSHLRQVGDKLKLERCLIGRPNGSTNLADLVEVLIAALFLDVNGAQRCHKIRKIVERVFCIQVSSF